MMYDKIQLLVGGGEGQVLRFRDLKSYKIIAKRVLLSILFNPFILGLW